MTISGIFIIIVPPIEDTPVTEDTTVVPPTDEGCHSLYY